MIVVSALLGAVALGTRRHRAAVSGASNRHEMSQETRGGARGWAAMKSGTARTTSRTTGSGAFVTDTEAAKATVEPVRMGK